MIENFVRGDILIPSLLYNDSGCHVRGKGATLQAPVAQNLNEIGIDMQIDFYGLKFEATRITCYLWSPWRASALEHRLFNEVKQISEVHLEQEADEMRVQIAEAKSWKEALVNMSRLLKGWQEEAAGLGKERRLFRWLFEGDTDEHGFDHANDRACLWIYLRVGLDRGDLDQEEPSEWIDLNCFGLRFWPMGK
jgi:hypothetical protein